MARGLFYSVPRRVKGKAGDEFLGLTKVVHGLSCTECLVRFTDQGWMVRS